MCQRTNLIEADRRLSPLTPGKGWFRDVRLRRSGEAGLPAGDGHFARQHVWRHAYSQL